MDIERLLQKINDFISSYKGTGKELKEDLKHLIEEVEIKIEGINDN
jgi:hypothetical protein